jgi:hypothetical protein
MQGVTQEKLQKESQKNGIVNGMQNTIPILCGSCSE